MQTGSLFLSGKLTDAGIPNEMMYMTSLKTLYLQGNLILRRQCAKMQLNGNLICQMIGAVVQGTLLRVFTEAAGADADIDTIAIQPLASTMKTAVVVLTLKNLRCLLKIWACI